MPNVTNWRAQWATNLRVARTQKGLTQEGLAVAAGTTQAQVSLWETGRAPIRVEWMLPLSRALDVPVEELFPLPEPNGDRVHA